MHKTSILYTFTELYSYIAAIIWLAIGSNLCINAHVKAIAIVYVHA